MSSILSEMNLTEAQIEQLLFEQRGILEGTFKINAITNRIITILEKLKDEIIEDERTECMSAEDFPCLMILDGNIAYHDLDNDVYYVMNEDGTSVMNGNSIAYINPEDNIDIIPCTLNEIKPGDHFQMDFGFDDGPNKVKTYFYCTGITNKKIQTIRGLDKFIVPQELISTDELCYKFELI